MELPDGSMAIYKYDPFGRRVSKQLGAVITYFVYSDEGLVAEYDASGAMLKGYGWKPDNIWGTDPVFMVEGGQYFYYHNDHLGTPQKMTDGSGSVVWSAEYSAFGQALVTVSTVTNNLRFPGQYFDVETGLNYNYFRDYDPAIGRYPQADPIGLRGGINLYAYVGNKPINRRDPYGLRIARWPSRHQLPDDGVPPNVTAIDPGRVTPPGFGPFTPWDPFAPKPGVGDILPYFYNPWKPEPPAPPVYPKPVVPVNPKPLTPMDCHAK